MSNYISRGGRTLADIIKDPRKLKDEARDELSFAFRDILAENRITLEQWNLLTTRLLAAKYNGDPKTISQEKINLSRALAKDTLTWSRFVEALFALGFDDYDIVITMTNRDNDKSNKHKIKIRNPYKRVDTESELPLLRTTLAQHKRRLEIMQTPVEEEIGFLENKIKELEAEIFKLEKEAGDE